jgi:hypothetical protein
MTFLSKPSPWNEPRQSAKDAKDANKSESEILFAIFASFADPSRLLPPRPGFRGFAL